MLLEQLERTLLGNIALLLQELDRLEARRVLLLAHDTALAGLHEVLLREATGGVLGRAVEDLGLRAHRDLRTTLLSILTRRVAAVVSIHVVGVHLYIELRFYIVSLGTSPAKILSIRSCISLGP